MILNTFKSKIRTIALKLKKITILTCILKLKINATGSKNSNAKTCIHFNTKTSFKSLKEGCEYFGLSYKTQKNAILKKYSTSQFYYDNEYFERPTKEEISKKLSKIRVGEQNHRFGKPAWNKRETI